MATKDFHKFREAWFRGVYEKHFPELFFYSRSFTVDEELIRDVIQDAFVSLLDKNRLETVSNIRNYLFSCVRNSLYNKLKSESKRNRIRLEALFEAEDPSGDMAVEREQLIILTEEAIQSLPPACKTIFTLAKSEGLSYKRIAERMSLSVKTVEAQMGIAFRKIREYVAVAAKEKVR